LPVKAGWRGVKPSLDALIDVAAAGSVIKGGASQRPMRIVRLAALIAPADPTESSLRGAILWARARRAALLAAMQPGAYCFGRTGNPRQWRREALVVPRREL